MNQTLNGKLQELKDTLKSGLLSQSEYDEKRDEILTQWGQAETTDSATSNIEITTETGTAISLCKTLEIHSVKGNFKLIECIGGGRYGQVWEAEDLLAKKEKVGQSIKVLKFPGNEHYASHDTREEIAQLFEQEANYGRELNHNGIVNIMWFDFAGGWPFIVMEYLEGESLYKFIKREGKQNLDDILALLAPVASGLDHAHKKHIIHRDIKPENIILTQEGAKIIDFGLAAQIRATTGLIDGEGENYFQGSIPYAAPELFDPNKKANYKQDTYALACIIYEMLTGKPPFTEHQAKNRQEKFPAKAPEGLHGTIWKTLAIGLEIDPDKRPETAKLLLENIEKTTKQVTLEELRQRFDSFLAKGGFESPKGKNCREVLLQLHRGGAEADWLSKAWKRLDKNIKKDVVQDHKLKKLEKQLNNEIRQQKELYSQLLDAKNKQIQKQNKQLKRYSKIQRKIRYQNDKHAKKKLTIKQITSGALNKSVSATIKSKKRELASMVWLPSGEFLMGSPESESGRCSNETYHKVEIQSFAIGKYPVTFAEYALFCKRTNRVMPDDHDKGKDEHPVINVTWDDAFSYAQWLTELTSSLYRLPTEAEWEYACRAGTITKFSFGDTITTKQANFFGRYKSADEFIGKTTSVGSYPANAFGIFDMHGNVNEWTCSAPEKVYSGKEVTCSKITDGLNRVYRGGSHLQGAKNLRSANRQWEESTYRSPNLGFRLAASL